MYRHIILLTKATGIIIFSLLIYGCGGDTDSRGLLKLDRYEEVDVNVYFYFEDSNKDYFLGQVRGASACGSMARGYAYDKSVQNTNWSYICITTDGKHKIR